MNRNRIRVLTVTVLLAALLSITAFWFVHTSQRQPAETPAAVQTLLQPGGGSGPRTPSAQCVNPHCAAASPNMECEYWDGGCQTWVMGGGGGGAFSAALMAKDGNYDHAEFLAQRVMRNNQAMAAAGIEAGDTVTHVDGLFFPTQKEFADAILDLRGKTLRIIRPNNTIAEVKLK